MDFLSIITTSILSSAGMFAVLKFVTNTSSKLFTDRLIEKFKAANSAQLEKLKSELTIEIEGVKSKLKNSELIFSQRLIAAAEFSKIIRSILPTYTFPNMDWSDACDHAAYGLDDFSGKIRKFIMEYKYVLPESVYSIVEIAAGKASELSHEITEEISPELNTAVGMLLNELFDAEAILLKVINDSYSSK